MDSVLGMVVAFLGDFLSERIFFILSLVSCVHCPFPLRRTLHNWRFGPQKMRPAHPAVRRSLLYAFLSPWAVKHIDNQKWIGQICFSIKSLIVKAFREMEWFSLTREPKDSVNRKPGSVYHGIQGLVPFQLQQWFDALDFLYAFRRISALKEFLYRHLFGFQCGNHTGLEYLFESGLDRGKGDPLICGCWHDFVKDRGEKSLFFSNRFFHPVLSHLFMDVLALSSWPRFPSHRTKQILYGPLAIQYLLNRPFPKIATRPLAVMLPPGEWQIRLEWLARMNALFHIDYATELTVDDVDLVKFESSHGVFLPVSALSQTETSDDSNTDTEVLSQDPDAVMEAASQDPIADN